MGPLAGTGVAGQPKPTRKRNRKRKRRVVSVSSSSEQDSSSSSSSSDASTSKKTVTIPVWQPKASENADADEDQTSSSSDESSGDDSDSDEIQDVDVSMPPSRPQAGPGRSDHPLQRDSPSPQPNVDIPPFDPSIPNASHPESEHALREKFRKFWMASIAEGFKDDLEAIRKEPDLGPSRLALLIESLASGADVFSSSSVGGCVNEMEVVLDQLPGE